MIGLAMDEGQRNRRRNASDPDGVGAVSSAPRQQAGRPDEHHDDEEGEGEHIAPFKVGEQTAQRDDLGEDESRDEGRR